MNDLRDRLMHAADEFEKDAEKGLPHLLMTCGEAIAKHPEGIEKFIAVTLLQKNASRIHLMPPRVVGMSCYVYIKEAQSSPLKDPERAMHVESFMLQAANIIGLPFLEYLLDAQLQYIRRLLP